MSPETLPERKADFASDVYSYSILLWQIVTCQCTPYGNMNNMVKLVDFRDAVGYNNVRPGSVLSDESALKDRTAVAKLIDNCWDGNPTKRPTFRQIVKVLEQNEQQRSSNSSNRANTGTTGGRFWNRLRIQQRQHNAVCST